MQNDNQEKPVSFANLAQAILGVKGKLYQPTTYDVSNIASLTNEQIDTLINSASVGDVIVQHARQNQQLKVIGKGYEVEDKGINYHVIAAGTDGIYRIDKLGSSYGYTYGVTRCNCYADATGSASGLMSSSDKTKLDKLKRDWTVFISSIWPGDEESFWIAPSYGGEPFSSSNAQIGDTVSFSGTSLSNSKLVVEGRDYLCFCKSGSNIQLIGPAKNEGFVVIEADVDGTSGDITARPLISKSLATKDADGLMSAEDKAKLDDTIICDGVKTVGEFYTDTSPTKFAVYDMSDLATDLVVSLPTKAILIGYDNDYAVFADVNDVSNKFTIAEWTVTPSFHEGVYGYEGPLIPDAGIEIAINNAGKSYSGAHTHSASDISDLPQIIIQ